MKFKNTFYTVLFTFLVFSCSTKKEQQKSDFTVITGVFNMPYQTEVELSKIEHGKAIPIGTSKLNNNNEFGFAVKPEQEGFYVLGTRNVEIPLYIKGNQIFDISYSPDGYEMKNFPDEENKVLYSWLQAVDTLKVFDFGNRSGVPKTYKEFFPFYESFIPVMKKQHELVNTSNTKFNKLMHAYIDTSIEYTGIHFLFTPRVEHPDPNKLPAFYQEFKNSKTYNSTAILNVPKGGMGLILHGSFKNQYGIRDVDRNVLINNTIKDIENDTLRGYVALNYIKQFKSYNEDYINFIEPIRADIALSEYVTSEVDKFEVSIKNTTPGTQGYPFIYKDATGKEVAFKDFRGKYVYIDVWATWCAPCKKEIPYIKQLEKDLHGQPIQFVSISVDKQKDHEKWLNFIKEEELTGVQLFSDDAFNTRIAKDYKINAIPRFLLFDPEGKIIDANAKRPSDPLLKKQLLNLFNK